MWENAKLINNREKNPFNHPILDHTLIAVVSRLRHNFILEFWNFDGSRWDCRKQRALKPPFHMLSIQFYSDWGINQNDSGCF